MAFQREKPVKIGVKAPFPGFVAPALATAVDTVPKGTRWIHEIKFDGYRVQVHLRDATVKVFTRRGNDWTKRFRKIAHDAWHVNAGSAIIDGEIVVPAADGTTDFSVLQNEMKKIEQDRACRLRPALSQRLRPSKTAADAARLSRRSNRARRWRSTPAGLRRSRRCSVPQRISARRRGRDGRRARAAR